jgi:hypothetical protein
MSTAVAERRARTRHSAHRARAGAEVARREGVSRVDDGQTPSTLEDSLARAWEDLSSRGRAECLVCGGELAATAGAAARCGACGSALE